MDILEGGDVEKCLEGHQPPPMPFWCIGSKFSNRNLALIVKTSNNYVYGDDMTPKALERMLNAIKHTLCVLIIRKNVSLMSKERLRILSKKF